jgi:hypothetical protein
VDFQTGVYDYNVMISTFMGLDLNRHAHAPTKPTLSMQDWCGHMFDQLVATYAGCDRQWHSDLDGESTTEGLARPSRAVSEEAPLMDARLHHKLLSWTSAILPADAARTLETPAGTRDVVPWHCTGPGGGDGHVLCRHRPPSDRGGGTARTQSARV